MIAKKRSGRVLAGSLAACCLVGGASAQQAQSPQQQGPRWDSLPLMKLEAFYRGPLLDTVIQRWRDPVDGSICYLYMPISAEHSQTPNSSYVQYGGNQIGSISCFAPPVAVPPAVATPAKPQSSKTKPPAPRPRDVPAQ